MTSGPTDADVSAGSAPPQSEALAKLLGIDAPSSAAPSSPTSSSPASNSPATGDAFVGDERIEDTADEEPVEAEPFGAEPGGSGAGSWAEADWATDPAPAGAEATPWEAPLPDPISAELSDTERPQRLDEAIPSGEQFDAGVAGLLEPDDPASPTTPPELPAQRTAKGLTRRDRTQSRAPIGEGRVIPTPATR